MAETTNPQSRSEEEIRRKIALSVECPYYWEDWRYSNVNNCAHPDHCACWLTAQRKLNLEESE